MLTEANVAKRLEKKNVEDSEAVAQCMFLLYF